MKTEPAYVGIDVAKDRMDIFIRPTGHSWSSSYGEAEVDELVAKLQTIQPTVAIVEATGGLELPLVAALAAASLPVAVVNPRQVRDFAKSTGQLAKNDRLDARILAHFGEAVRPTVRPLRDAESQLGFPQFKRRKRGSPPFGGTERRGIPECRGWRLTVRNLPTPARGADAPGRWHPRRSATVCRTRRRCVG